jgi:unsaturated rhamnogalacturonyl hydrolase
MRLLRSLLLLSLCSVAAFATEPPRQFGEATPLEWAQRMARSEMQRYGDTLFLGGAPRARWDYTTTLLGLSLMKLSERTGDATYGAWGERTATSFIGADGSIATYRRDEYNIDMIPPGKLLLLMREQGRSEPRIGTAIEALRDQMRTHPRTSEGGYWHKLRYPHQMWLDGLFMASPFLAHYAKLYGRPELYDDVANQISLMDRHAWNAERDLHYHAWDERREQPWADPQRGTSPNFWSRAIGWYGMALVDALDFFPPTHPEVEHINEILRRVADGIVRWQDPASGLWWQVTDQGGRPGNYLEGTASSMFTYILAKGINRGYLPRERYLPALLKGYDGLIRDLVRTNPDGTVSLLQCCSVAGLGYTNSAGRVRDGSFDYYISEPIIENDLKGTGPFILAGIEMQQLVTTPVAARAVRGWGDYPHVLSLIRDPQFPDRDFPITDFGAVAGTDASAALGAAIAACHAAGGGRVIVPAGDWPTGPVQLLSNVNLHLAAGAVLRFSTNPADYPLVLTRWEGVECLNYAPLLSASGQENIAVTGSGTLDGQADWTNWWGWNNKSAGQPTRQVPGRDRLFALEERVMGEGSYLRPQFLQTYRCRNVLIEGVTILRSPMWVIHPVLSENVTVRGVKVISHGTNNDGCNPESSRNVLIEDCLFDTGDDCIAIKSGRNDDGRRLGVPSENIVIRRSVMKDGHGGVVLGSECSGGIRNVFVEHCEMDSPNLDRALRFKSNAVRGGVLENVFFRDVRIGRVAEAVVTIDLLYEEGAAGAHPPVVRNVQLERVTSTSSPRVLFIRAFPGAVIDGLRLADSTFSNLTEPDVVEHAGAVSYHNVTLRPARAGQALNTVPARQP